MHRHLVNALYASKISIFAGFKNRFLSQLQVAENFIKIPLCLTGFVYLAVKWLKEDSASRDNI